MSAYHSSQVLQKTLCQIQEEMQLWPDLEYPLFQVDVVNKAKKVARHSLIQSFVLGLNVKSELPIPEPAIFGIMDADENDPVSFWVDKGKVDNFLQILPKSWELLVRADRINSSQYSLLGSMDPENIVKENNNILLFVFEYFAQKDISGLIDETLQK